MPARATSSQISRRAAGSETTNIQMQTTLSDSPEAKAALYARLRAINARNKQLPGSPPGDRSAETPAPSGIEAVERELAACQTPEERQAVLTKHYALIISQPR